MEFRDVLSVLVEAADARAEELRDLIDMAVRESEIVEDYRKKLAEVERAITAGRLYLEKTPA